mgnify:CR=1 FL=1
MSKIKIIIFLILISTFVQFSYSDTIEIKVKINNEIITNLDIENEKKYLLFLNPKLIELERSKVEDLARNSLITEIIKKIELEKFFDFTKNNHLVNKIEKQLIKRRNISNVEDFKKILKSKDLNYFIVKEKLLIETLWNKLIFEKYKNQINIDEKELESKILKKKELINEKIYQLSEIIFKKDNNKTIVQITEEIKKSVSEVGFKNTANIFSLSDSSKFGGNIGWVKEKNLSKKIYKEINTLKIGDLSEAIQVGNNFLILKINNIKTEKIKTDKNKELQKIIEFEKNRQLNQFSMIYFNKIQINTNVEKL